MIYDTIFSIMLCAAGYVFAAHSCLSERDAAKQCAAAILLGCIAYNWAWYSYSPHMLMGIRSTSYWSVVDANVAIYVIERGLRHWWGLPLYMLLVLQICLHVTRAFDFIAFYPYSVIIDTIGYLQILLFLYLGGPGVRDRFLNSRSDGRNGMGSHKAAQSKA